MPQLSFFICTQHWSGESRTESGSAHVEDLSFTEYFCWDMTCEVCRLLLISSHQHADEEWGCRLINYNNWTVIQIAILYRSLLVFPFYTFHEIFITSEGELFPVFIYSSNLNGVQDRLTVNMIYSCVISDESCIFIKEHSRHLTTQ